METVPTLFVQLFADRDQSRSRRIQQRTLKRQRSRLERFLKSETERLKQRSDTDAKFHACASSLRVYGFVPDLEADVWTNRINVLGSMTPRYYFNRPNNMPFHNLCQNTTLPSGIGISWVLVLSTASRPHGLGRNLQAYSNL